MAIRRLRPALVLGALIAASSASGQVTVSLSKIYQVETVYVSDFSPYNVGQQPNFLSIKLTNNGASAQNVRLRLRIVQERPANVLLFEGTTGTFRLSGTRDITNGDLSNEKSDVVIEDYEITDQADDLTEKVAQSGRLPSGTYVFQVHIMTPAGVTLGDAEVRYELVNPTRLTLLSPGQLFGDQAEVVTTPAPTFQWSADEGVIGGLGSYKIRVVRVGASASSEDAMQGFPSWEGTTTATTAVYPGSVSALPLLPGQTYAWQVTREVRTSSGAQSVVSPIYWFKMSGGNDPHGSTADLGSSLQLDQLLRDLGLGPDLNGYHPTGQVTVDGLPGSFENLEALIRAILDGQITIHSATVQ